MRFLFAAFFLALLGSEGWSDLASNVDLNPDLRKQGRMFTVTAVPVDKQMKIYLAGRELAGVSVKNAKVRAYVVRGKEKTEIDVSKMEGYYLVRDQIPPESRLLLKVSGEKGGEDFEIRMK